METYYGQVRTPTDAIILFEACRLGLLPRVQRRLSEKERQSIRSGSVFVWDEREAGMRRWTDGKSWSASRVSGSFLTYREMEGKRGTNSYVAPGNRVKGLEPGEPQPNEPQEDAEEGPDGYRYKPDGLMKQSFSITTSQGQHLHLISYFSRSHPTAQVLRLPSTDPQLSSIVPQKGMYPESTINDQSNVPAVTRSPMAGAPSYVMAPAAAYPRGAVHPHYYAGGYMPHPAYIYPLSPAHSPHSPYAMQPYPPPPNALPPLGYPQYGQPPPMVYHHAPPPPMFDQRPPQIDSKAPQSAPPPSIQHSTSAPSPYGQSQPPPQMPHSMYSSPSQPNHQSTESFSRQLHAPEIDPRLTGGMYGETDTAINQPKVIETTEARTGDASVSAASQAPSITALVNSESVGEEAKSNRDHDREQEGSASPGGTNGAPPRDIPSEKLGFREDKRVLRQLDSVFARV